MFTILSTAASFAGKLFLGTHLFGGVAKEVEHGVWYVAEGLGWRFFAGLTAALYFTNPGVHRAVNGVGKAILGVVV